MGETALDHHDEDIDFDPVKLEQEAEQWKTIEGWGGAYDVSDLGRVRSRWTKACVGGKVRSVLSTKPTKVLATRVSSNGYVKVRLCDGQGKIEEQWVHRLTLQAFRPQQVLQFCQAHHLNGDRENNRLDNLEWLTGSENSKERSERNSETKGGADENCD